MDWNLWELMIFTDMGTRIYLCRFFQLCPLIGPKSNDTSVSNEHT